VQLQRERLFPLDLKIHVAPQSPQLPFSVYDGQNTKTGVNSEKLDKMSYIYAGIAGLRVSIGQRRNGRDLALWEAGGSCCFLQLQSPFSAAPKGAGNSACTFANAKIRSPQAPAVFPASFRTTGAAPSAERSGRALPSPRDQRD
jgi:hypothetical protein